MCIVITVGLVLQREVQDSDPFRNLPLRTLLNRDLDAAS